MIARLLGKTEAWHAEEQTGSSTGRQTLGTRKHMNNDPDNGGLLRTRTGIHRLGIAVANTFLRRLRGLMFSRSLPADSGLLIIGCNSVHTAFMRYAIDVVYLDKNGTVVRCVTKLEPWRGSFANMRIGPRAHDIPLAAHTLELAAGTIGQLGIEPGDRLRHPCLLGPPNSDLASEPGGLGAQRRSIRQQGAAMVEFVVIAPLLTVMGLATVEYGGLFFAKNQINHAAFMAARAGSVANANLTKIQEAYAQALIPMYGGGQTPAALAASLNRATSDLQTNSRIELLNPTKESFDDWSDAALEAKLDTGGRRVIPNSNLAAKGQAIGATSGQTLSDANLVKLRITHGYEPVAPMVKSVYKAYLQAMDPGNDDFHTQMLAAGRIPVVTNVTLQMQSDPIEPLSPVSVPGPGNGGNPVNQGDPPTGTGTPPNCPLGGCSTTPGSGTGAVCPAPITTTLSADTLFGFDQATLQPAGIAKLNDLIAKATALGTEFETLNITGYTDPIGGNSDYNLTLSKARAQAVSDYLATHGLKATNVNVKGLGATDFIKPLSACSNLSAADTKACLAPNRRVVVELKPKA